MHSLDNLERTDIIPDQPENPEGAPSSLRPASRIGGMKSRLTHGVRALFLAAASMPTAADAQDTHYHFYLGTPPAPAAAAMTPPPAAPDPTAPAPAASPLPPALTTAPVIPALPAIPSYAAEIGGFEIIDRYGQTHRRPASRFGGTGANAAQASRDARREMDDRTRSYNRTLDSIGSPTHAVITPVYPVAPAVVAPAVPAPLYYRVAPTVAAPPPAVAIPPMVPVYGRPPYVYVPTATGGYYLGGY